MPVLRVNNKNVLFIHIPKTGGATVERYLRQVGKLGFFLGGMNQQLYQCTPQHFDAEMYAALFPEGFFDYQFAFVRHPLDRVISEYKMRVSRPFRDGREYPSFDKWFDRFPEKLSENPRILDNHLNQQSKFIDKSVKIFKFEDGIIENLKQVQADMGVTFNLEKDIHAQKSSASITANISDSKISEICDIYASDFEEFGYELESARYFNS